MKKIIILLLILNHLSSSNLAFAQNGAKRIEKNKGGKHYRFKIAKHRNGGNFYMAKPVFSHSFGDYNIPNTFPALNVITIDSVSKALTNFSTNGLNNSASSFVFKASDLKKYMDASLSPTIQLMLASDPTTNQMFLVLLAVDVNGDHVYLTNNNACYTPVSSVPTAGILNTLTDVSATGIRNFYFGAATASNAAGWIGAYTSTMKNQTTTWIYSKDILSNYIYNGLKGNMVYIQFILCNIGNQLSFIIVGVDGQNKHMFFNYQVTNCVLENCNPCPICALNSLESCN